MLKGTGMYTKGEKNVLFCIVKKNQIVKIKKAILSIGENAFISIYPPHII
nr:DUF2179 domain-containing protein [Sporosalibacterium faouarense]